MTCGAPDWSVIVGPAKGLVCLTASKSRRETSENPAPVANQFGPESALTDPALHTMIGASHGY